MPEHERRAIVEHAIQAQLGHASLAVTSTYLTHIAPAQLVEAMRTLPAFAVELSLTPRYAGVCRTFAGAATATSG